MKPLAAFLATVLLGFAPLASAQMSTQEAREEGKSMAEGMRSDESWIPTTDAQAEAIPGYKGTDVPEAQYYNDPDKLTNEANARKGSNEVYQITTDANKERASFSIDEIKDVTANARGIENDPSSQLGGEEFTSTKGECQALPAQEQKIYYDATCDTGVVLNFVPSNTIYSCPPGWTLKDQICSLREVIPATLSYSCDAGWTLNGAKCGKVEPAKITAYSCPSGWTLKGSRCSRTLTQGAKLTGYTCPRDFNLEGSTCKKTITANATAKYSCKPGFSLSGTQCIRDYSYPATPQYSCNSGYKLSGSQCIRDYSYPVTPQYSCNAGYKLSGTQCIKDYTYTATPNYSCNSGYKLSGTQCIRDYSYGATPSYSCNAGYNLSGTKCIQETSYQATPEYFCDYEMGTLSGSNCVRNFTARADKSYSCESGWRRSGSQCIRESSQPATQSYSCPAGYTMDKGAAILGGLTGSTVRQCTQSANYQATATYTCPNGGTVNGTQCDTSSTTSAEATLSCPYYSYNTRFFNSPRCVQRKAENSGNRCNTTVRPDPNDVQFIGEFKMYGDKWCVYSPRKTYTCPSGYGNYDPQYNHCSQKSSTPGVITYTCPQGGNLSGTTCHKRNVTGATVTNKCPSDYKLSGTQCIKSETKAANVTYSCRSGYTLSGSSCVRTQTVRAILMGYSCPNGGTQSGSTCVLRKEANANVRYSCPNGGSLSGSTCRIYDKVSANVRYSCPSGGSLSGSTCRVYDTASANVRYSCPSGGSLSGSTCRIYDTANPNVRYSCPKGGSLSGTSCNAREIVAAVKSYYCPSGYTLSGTTCSRTEAKPGSPVYACPTGYELSGTSCSRYEEEAAKPIYACPTGFTLSGTQCTGTVPAYPNYHCPSTYTLDGKTCVRTQTQGAGSHQKCPEGTNTNTDGKCYTEEPTSSCGELEGNPECSWKNDNCLDDEPSAGGCKVTERVFKCPVPGETAKQPAKYVCGDDVYCINGDCEKIQREASSEFKDTLVALKSVDKAGDDYQVENLKIFPGNRQTCSKPIFGTVDCCAGKVSGLIPLGIGTAALTGAISGNAALLLGIGTQFLTTFSCSTEEKMLDVKDRMGFCIFVGSYCSSKLLGVCSKKKKTYCCFDSKLSRILQEQGRPQINKPFEKAKKEQCEGFTVDEFSRLDLSKMDFTEVYADFMDAAKMPDSVETMTDIRKRIQDYYDLHGK